MISGIGGIGSLKLEPSTGGAGAAGTAVPGGGAATTFADALSQAATKTIETLEGAEQVSMQALKGDADTRQVADAVMNAQQALQTAIAIRDKIVSAYLDISRMSI
jgi:flagellar hook-basal body complex protein FliE